jgi:signal transduction histidine kinase
MRVRTKILLLLAGVIVIFAAGLLWLKEMDRRQFQAMSEGRLRERTEAFDRFLENRGASLETFVSYYACWDAMVEAIGRGDHAWVEANLTEHALASFRAHVVWIYRPDHSVFHTRNYLYSAALDELPAPAGVRDALLAGAARTSHFFAPTSLGMVEVRGATVHPSRDGARATPPRGILFAGRLWSQEDLKEMSLFTGNVISLAQPQADAASAAPGPGTVEFSRLLPGWDGQPVARLVVRNDAPLVVQFQRLSSRMLLWVIAFAVTVLALFAVLLRVWVTQPMKLISRALRNEDSKALKPLEDDPCEFGDLARVIRVFFEQRESLIEQMRERRQAEQALHASEEQLRHAHKMEAIGRLAGGVAHDFNNLLTAIIGYGELLREKVRGDSNAEQGADCILNAAERAAGLTGQLLAFSRKQVLHPRVIDVNALVRETEKLLRRIIGEHIELRVRAEAPQARVRVDPTQLQQVIVNLAVNARDAMPRGGILTIETGDALIPEPAVVGGTELPGGKYVTLAVRDTGSGMDEETKLRIFEPFFTTKESGKGTGLGLATVYGIVQQSGGGIAVESTPNIGTTFLIHLPMEDAEVEPARPQLVVPGRSARHETIVVLEDDKVVRDLICAVLTDYDYHVLCAGNCQEALRLADAHRGDAHLLVADVVMPVMSGPRVAEALRERWPELKVLYISGYAADPAFDSKVPGLEFDVLEKPFTPRELAAKVREILTVREVEADGGSAPGEGELVPAGPASKAPRKKKRRES